MLNACVRNRLVLSYFLFGVVPVVLIGALIVVTLELSLGHDKKSVPGRYLTQSGFLFLALSGWVRAVTLGTQTNPHEVLAKWNYTISPNL